MTRSQPPFLSGLHRLHIENAIEAPKEYATRRRGLLASSTAAYDKGVLIVAPFIIRNFSCISTHWARLCVQKSWNDQAIDVSDAMSVTCFFTIKRKLSSS